MQMRISSESGTTQMQIQAVSGSDISLSMDTPQKNFVLTDMSPDLSAGIKSGRVIAQVFCEPSKLDSHTSHLQNQMRFVIVLIFDFKPVITKPTFRKSWILIFKLVSVLSG